MSLSNDPFLVTCLALLEANRPELINFVAPCQDGPIEDYFFPHLDTDTDWVLQFQILYRRYYYPGDHVPPMLYPYLAKDLNVQGGDLHESDAALLERALKIGYLSVGIDHHTCSTCRSLIESVASNV